MRSRLLLACVVVPLTLSGCSHPGAATRLATAAGLASPVSPELGMPDVPVDSSLTPISRSAPAKAASAALNLCVREGEMDLVSGMAELPASEVHRFMLTNGKEPELQGDTPVFAVQFKGPVPERYGTMIDPLCVVFEDGTRFYYMPYGLEGQPSKAPPDFKAATSALPPFSP